MENPIEQSPGRRVGDQRPRRMRRGMYILPSMFDKDVVPTIAKAVASATRAAGLSRRTAIAEG